MKNFSSLVFLIVIYCNGQGEPLATGTCQTFALDKGLVYQDLISSMPAEVITNLTERPDQLGALGRNKNGYFHVRFQLHMTRLADYTIRFQSKEGLLELLKSIKYSFAHQRSEVGFEFHPPEAITNAPDYRPPSEANLASGTAFFAYSLGLGLLALLQSEWFINSQTTSDARADIKALNPDIANILAYLKRSEKLLEKVDAQALNRLLFNAMAFYSLGLYLEDCEAQKIGLKFATKALSLRNEAQGYFIEGGGWDSSYNGVALKLGLELYSLLPNDTELVIKQQLQKALSCAGEWQKSRILRSGEISTKGNTRVFKGGEVFLGNEKGVDVIKTVKAFFYLSTLSGKAEYATLARRIIAYYQ